MHKINLTPEERKDLGQKMKQARKLKKAISTRGS